MSLRNKLLLNSFFVILFFSILYLILSFVATNVVFQRYENYIQKQITDQTKDVLVSYYVNNGQRWVGVYEYMKPYFKDKNPRRTVMALLDDNNKLVALWPGGTEEYWRVSYGKNNGAGVSIVLHDRQIGTLWMPTGHPMGFENIRNRVSSSLVFTLLICVLISSVIAFIISYALADRISKPLKSLSKAAQQVGRRRFDMRLPVTSRDEIGVVIRAFNEMSEELQRSEQVRRKLVADVAHELRTPLTVIQGQLESIQQGILPASVEHVLPIHDEVIRLNRLVDDLRQLTLAEAGKLPLNRIATDIGRSVQKIADNFQWEAEARGIELRVDNFSDPLVVEVDPDRFTQIVVNLLGNAIRYTSTDGYVSIGTKRMSFSGEEKDLESWCKKFTKTGTTGTDNSQFPSVEDGSGIIVWVADRGPGINPEQLPFVFDRFYRAEESRDRGSGGVGLGLAIAREFVAAHGGYITACNIEGGGSLFAFYLPGGEN